MDAKEQEAKVTLRQHLIQAHEFRGDQLVSSSPNHALSEFTTAIELLLSVASNPKASPVQRTRCRTACKHLMERAETLKRHIQLTQQIKVKDPVMKPPPLPLVRKRTSRVLPQSETKLSVKEETILLKSSKINGGIFPPLKPATTPVVVDTAEPFTDPYGFLSLSACQEALLGEWQRPHEFLEEPCLLDDDGGNGGMYLVQDMITDCSLVASLCSAAAWEVKHHAKIVTNNIYPQRDYISILHNMGSNSGKYIILLHLNGCIRQIVIDDYLPQSRDGKPLHVISLTNPNLLYPALIEKAFLKVMGGYDFPGSNSATDLHILTGWIPEVVHLQGDDSDLEQLWKKTFRAWSEGDVLATVGTSSLTPIEEQEFGLVGDHNYSIFGMSPSMINNKDMLDNNRRLLQIRNPWSRGGIPKSAFSTSDLWDALPSPTPNEAVDGDKPSDPSVGTFWVDYTVLSQSFKTLYLNWNPALFQYCQRRHLSFAPSGSDFDVGGNGQFSISLDGTGDVWILVERHYLGKSEGWEGYIGLAVFPGNERIYSYTRATYRTEYVDGNHTLLKISGFPAKQSHTILVIANDKTSAPPQPQRFFTLTVYATFPISLSDPLDALPYEVRLQGLWRKGISYKSPLSTFVENPQWKLVVPEGKSTTARVIALLESKDEETAVNVTIAWSAGKRLARLANQDILCQSGEYAPHHAKTSSRNVKLSTQYTVIASRFEEVSSLEEPFTLVLRCDVPVTLTPLREKWAGKSRKQVVSTWDSGETTKRFILSTQRLTSFSVRLTAPHSKTLPFVRLCLREGTYDEEDEEEGEELVSSGEQYTDLSLGEPCAIEGFDLVGGEEYVLCVDRLGDEGDEGGEFVLDFLADGELEPVEI